MALPSRMLMAGRTMSSPILFMEMAGTASMWQEITPLRLQTTLSTKTVRPPDQPAEDLALDERVPTILNLRGSSCATILSAATCLARSMDRCWTPRIQEISHRREAKGWG